MNHKHLAQMIYLALVMLLVGACDATQPTPTVTTPTMTPPVAASSDVVYVTPLQPDVTEQRLDIYTPSEEGDWPVIVFLHGYDGTKEWYAPLSQAIAEQGAVVFTAAWPTWIADLAAKENGKGFREMSEVLSCAIRFARATAPDYGGDPSRVTLVGHSFGAETGAWIALAGDNLDRSWEEFDSNRGGPPSQVECVVSGVSANIDAFVGIGGGYNSTGPLQKRDSELWQITDPYAHLGQNLDLRVRLIHGERDSTVRPEHAIQFNDALAEAGYDTSLTMWDGTHRVPTELTVAEIIKVAREPAITPEIAEMESADKPEVVHSFDTSRGELPEGITIDKAGNIYVSLGPPLFVGGGFGEIWKISPDGAETMLAQFDGGPPAAGLAVDADANLYYAYPVDEGDDQGGVYRLAADGDTERLPGTENIILPNGLAFDDDVNLYVSDSILGAIWRIPPGGPAELWLQHELLAGCLPDDPFGANGVALWEGNLYAANTGKGILVSVPILADGAAGEPDLVAGAGDCDAKVKELYGMDGIALDAEGNVYALLVLQNKLVKINPADGSFSILLTKDNGLHNPASIVFGIGEDNQSIIFTNYAVLPPEPAASPGPAVLKFDVGVPGLPLPDVTATISPTPAPDIKTERIAVPYEDRVIRGTLMGEGDIAVVLAPMWGVPRGHWLPFAKHIASLGYTALAFDFPGFGTSSGDFNFDQTTFDVLALIDFLQQERGYERIVCMGASLGASACYKAALLDPSLLGLVIISSPVEITAAEAATLVMPKLLVSGNEPEVIPGMQDSIELLPAPKKYKKILVPAHGTDIFNTDSSDELCDLLVGFLEELR